VIIVLEGLENFIDSETKKESFLKFWLPKTFPDRVRVIVTASPNSKSQEYLKNLGSDVISIVADKKSMRSEITKATSKNPDDYLVDQYHVKKCAEIIERKIDMELIKMIFLKSFFSFLCPMVYDGINNIPQERAHFEKMLSSLNYKSLESLEDEVKLVIFVIEFYENKLTTKINLLQILSMLCLTHKGLTTTEILRVVKIEPEDLSRILAVFKCYLMCYQGFWVCNNEILRAALDELYYCKPEKKEDLHKKIALMLEKTPNSVRKLEEQTYHLYSGKDYFTLKQTISTIENFLLLFNPMNKFDLFRYWQILEHFGYDPVIEYNKGIELFDTHYTPEPDKLFMIILQVCRFLKEFSDFETDITPVFRHPLIRGKIAEKPKKDENGKAETDQKKKYQERADKSREKSPGVAGTSKDLAKIKVKNDQKQSEKKQKGDLNTSAAKQRKREDPLGLNDPFYNEDNELSDVDDKKDNKGQATENTYNYLDGIGLLKELKNFKLTIDTNTSSNNAGESLGVKKENKKFDERNNFKRRFDDILEDWEDVNIEVPEGRAKFRKMFLEILEKKYHYKNKRNQLEDTDIPLYQHQDDIKDDSHSKKLGLDYVDFKKEDEETKHKYQSMIDDIDLQIKPEKDPSFYYYKR
jgi:hypothetical protein